jgi:DNA-binding NarL/FixJ family response regulator
MIKILIVDDHKMFVEGLEFILSKEEDIQIVDRLFEGNKVFDNELLNKVDIILLDINLPDISGIEVCERILKMRQDIKILVLSMHDEESYITEVLKSGALGYVLKGLMNNNKKAKPVEKEVPKITRREKEILDLIMEENTNQEIAGKLFISLKTVEAHRSNLLSKLNARNTAGLVKKAIELQLG